MQVCVCRMNTMLMWCDIEYQYFSFCPLWAGTLYSTWPHFSFVTQCSTYTYCVNQAAAAVTEWTIDANRAVELTYKKKEMRSRRRERKYFNSTLTGNMERRHLSRETKRAVHISSMPILKITIGVRRDWHLALKWNKCPSNIDSYFHRIVYIKRQNSIHHHHIEEYWYKYK